MVDITFVPLWLERHLKSMGHPVTVLKDTIALANILSPRDLENYKLSKEYFQQTYLAPQGLVPVDLKWCNNIDNLNDTLILSYLYGNTFVGSGASIGPEFDINVIGDGVYVTVPYIHDGVETTSDESGFVTSLITTLINYMSLKQIAKTQLFRNYVLSLAQTSKIYS